MEPVIIASVVGVAAVYITSLIALFHAGKRHRGAIYPTRVHYRGRRRG